MRCPTTAEIDSLERDDRRVLRAVADGEMEVDGRVQEAQVLLAWPVGDAERIRRALRVLGKRYFLSAQPWVPPVYQTTPAGLLAANGLSAPVTAILEDLLSYLKGRLAREGLRFQRFSSAELHEAFPEHDVGLVAQVVRAFELHRDVQRAATPGPDRWIWDVPIDLVDFRGFDRYEALYERWARTHNGYFEANEPEQPDPREALVEQLWTAMHRALRSHITAAPAHEREVQDAVERILRTLGVSHVREHERTLVGARAFAPDFTVAASDLAIEVKLCTKTRKPSQIQEEIAADVAAYGTRWSRVLVVVYDCGMLPDPVGFAADNESKLGVRMLVLKH